MSELPPRTAGTTAAGCPLAAFPDLSARPDLAAKSVLIAGLTLASAMIVAAAFLLAPPSGSDSDRSPEPDASRRVLVGDAEFRAWGQALLARRSGGASHRST